MQKQRDGQVGSQTGITNDNRQQKGRQGSIRQTNTDTDKDKQKERDKTDKKTD